MSPDVISEWKNIYIKWSIACIVHNSKLANFLINALLPGQDARFGKSSAKIFLFRLDYFYVHLKRCFEESQHSLAFRAKL